MTGFSITNLGGSTFPLDPSDGDTWFHADRKIQYYWDAGRGLWLSTAPFTIDFVASPNTLLTTTTNLDVLSALHPWSGQYDIFAMDVSFGGYLTAAGSWTAQLRTVEGSTPSAALASWTHSTPMGTWVPSGPIAIELLIPAAIELFQFGSTQNSGPATFYGSACIRYRLVG